jgi:hypothetical protein
MIARGDVQRVRARVLRLCDYKGELRVTFVITNLLCIERFFLLLQY